MPRVKIGLQPALITYDTKKEGDEAGDGQSPDRTYIWCLPSSSARVVEYQVSHLSQSRRSDRHSKNALNLQLVDKIEIWKDLKRDVDLLKAGCEPLDADSLEFAAYAVDSLFSTTPTVKEETESPHFAVTPIKKATLTRSALSASKVTI